MCVENILACFDKASPEQIEEGTTWYHVAHEVALSVGAGNVQSGAGILAALSPRLRWDLNIAAAYELTRDGNTSRQFGANRDKALRILHGEKPCKVLGGLKVRAFYEAILHPHNRAGKAVIDRHAASVYYGVKLDAEGIAKALGSKPKVLEMQKAYAKAARKRGVSTYTMQATVWVVWRTR